MRFRCEHGEIDRCGEFALGEPHVELSPIVREPRPGASFDTLEQRGWVRRTPNPDDRRSLLIEITAAGRVTADTFLPGLHKLERRVMSELDDGERRQLLGLLERVLTRANEVMAEPLEPLFGIRRRPTRLG